jgi:hypothetical protein
MARYTVTTFQCPRCRADLGRQFGLITSRSIPCPRCGTMVHIDGKVIAQNWGFNFGWVGGLLLWLGLAAGVMLDPQFAASIGGKTFKSDTQQQRVIIALVCGLPALFGGLVCGGVGMLLASVMVGGGEAGPSLVTASGLSAAPPQPQSRGCAVRGFFILFWPVFVFVAGVIVMSGVSGAFSAETVELRNQINKESAEKYTKWVLLASFLVFLLGCFGIMPWTGSGKKNTPPPESPPGIDTRVFRP